MQDNDEQFPNGINPTGGNWFWAGEGWAGQSSAYIRNAAVLRCPDDLTSGNPPVNEVVSYGYNINLVTLSPYAAGGDPEDAGSYEGAPPSGVSCSRSHRPGQSVLLFEVSGVTADVTDNFEGNRPGGTPGRYLSASGNGLDNRLYAHRDDKTGYR